MDMSGDGKLDDSHEPFIKQEDIATASEIPHYLPTLYQYLCTAVGRADVDGEGKAGASRKKPLRESLVSQSPHRLFYHVLTFFFQPKAANTPSDRAYLSWSKEEPDLSPIEDEAPPRDIAETMTRRPCGSRCHYWYGWLTVRRPNSGTMPSGRSRCLFPTHRKKIQVTTPGLAPTRSKRVQETLWSSPPLLVRVVDSPISQQRHHAGRSLPPPLLHSSEEDSGNSPWTSTDALQ